jgi:curved DNA-binding protein
MDYYSILGVPKDATDKDLKSAYKKASMKHHPDRGGNEETFKQINEAYSTLKDPQKRGMYDHQQNGGGQGFNFNTSNMGGGNPFEDLFGSMFGGNPNMRRQQVRNPDVNIRVPITLKEVITGKKVLATYRLRNGQEQTVDLDIPIGAKHGDTIRFTGLGESSFPGPRGDLYVQVDISRDRNFERSGDNIILTLRVNCLQLITGCKQNIKTVEGKDIALTIPSNTKHGSTFSMNGYGLPNMHTNRRGSMLIKIEAEIPQTLTPAQIQKIGEIINGS